MKRKTFKKLLSLVSFFSLILQTLSPALIFAQGLTPAPEPQNQKETSQPTVAAQVVDQTQDSRNGETKAAENQNTQNQEPTPTPAPESAAQTVKTQVKNQNPATPAPEIKLDLEQSPEAEQSAQPVPTVATDKDDYTPAELVTISGSGYKPNQELLIEIYSDSLLLASLTAFTNQSGDLLSLYQLDGTYRPLYQIKVKSTAGDLLAETSFTDAVKITICHATGSGSYNTITLNYSADLNGHDGHQNDIIPVFWYNPRNSNDVLFTAPQPWQWWYVQYPGKNWDTAGQAIWNNNCQVPSFPDLTVTKTNNVSGNTVPNQSFIWTLTVTNSGTAPATFNNEDILEDDLPNQNVSYSPTSNIPVTVSGGVTGAIDCDIGSYTLDCDDNSGGQPVVIPAGGSFSLQINVTPSVVGTLQNPRSGGGNICQVDPDNRETESNETNNNCTDMVTVSEVAGPANPLLSQSCGLDIALVLDNSNSINSTQLNQMKSAMTGFITALAGTSTEFSVTRFATSAQVLQTFTNSSAAINNAINGIPLNGGYTNWEDGLLKAQSTFPHRTNPDLIIFASDGDPTASSAGPNTITQPNIHLDPAIAVANTLKTSGIRILMLGIGTAPTLERLSAISGPNVNTGDILTSDVITTDFSTLAQDLAAFAGSACGGTITVHKLLDADGSLETAEDQSAGENWEMTVSAGEAVVAPAFGMTNASGLVSFMVDTGDNGVLVEEVKEATQSGYLKLSAECKDQAGSNKGTESAEGVTDFTIGTSDIITCTFINTQARGSIIGTKYEDLNANGQRDSEGNTEPGLSGWEIKLYDSRDTLLNTAVTDIKGDYWFDALLPGDYRVCEVSQTGWVNTDPGNEILCKDLTVTQGQPAWANFGNRKESINIRAAKIICDSESDLPDWGNHGAVITAATAQDYVNAHPNCRLEEQWQFQWAGRHDGYTGQTSTDYYADWNTFTPGDIVELSLAEIESLGGRLEVREVYPDNYSPLVAFSGENGNVGQSLSAEIYCTGDVYNYDNWEWISNFEPGQTYYCLAFNALARSDVQVCKYDTAQNPLSGWRIGILGKKVETLSVPVDTSSVLSSSLPQDHYAVVGEGYYRFGNWGEYGIADAEWALRNDAYTDNPLADHGWTVGELTYPSVVGLDLKINNSNIDWGYFSPAHYYLHNLGNYSGQVGFSIYDNAVSDNANIGNFRASIYQGFVEETGEDGCVTFSNIPHGSYLLTEQLAAGWGNLEGNNSQIEVGEVENVFNLTNYRLTGSITVYKFNDLNANGVRDCEAVDSDEVRVCEPYLSGWDITLGDNTQTTDGSGKAVFSQVLPGQYNLSETGKTWWELTGISCAEDVEPASQQPYSLDLAAGDTLTCHIGNRINPPELIIHKENDCFGGDKSPGNSLGFTIRLKLAGSPLTGVRVTDLLPKWFTYKLGTWRAFRNGVEFSLPEPVYHSPGKWEVGDMEPGDVIELTYIGEISGDIEPGLYKDLAWAGGIPLNTEELGSDYTLAYAEDSKEPFAFVGTQVNVVKNQQDSLDHQGDVKVLGAATEFLPATGANSDWLLLALAALILGVKCVESGIKARRINE